MNIFVTFLLLIFLYSIYLIFLKQIQNQHQIVLFYTHLEFLKNNFFWHISTFCKLQSQTQMKQLKKEHIL